MSGAGRKDLADRVAALREPVLAGADAGEREPPGAEVFDAVVRALRGPPRRAASGPDRALHDAISRRLAWRDSELRVLSDAREVCRALLAAARRALDPAEEVQVAQAAADATSAAAAIVIQLVLERVARERAGLLREEVAQERLVQAIERQREELVRLEQTLGRTPGGAD
jgi:hypothetical protein